MLRKLLNKEKISEAFLSEAQDRTRLSKKELKETIRQLIKDDPQNHDDIYVIFLKAKANDLFRDHERSSEMTSRLRCLINIDRASGHAHLSKTTPPGSIVHALERMTNSNEIPDRVGKQAMLQYVLSCSHKKAVACFQGQASIVQAIEAARRAHLITDETARTARQSYFLLLDPLTVRWYRKSKGIRDTDAHEVYEAIERAGQGTVRVAVMREWKDISRDEIQSIIDNGYGHSPEEAKKEYLAQELMRKYKVDRAHAKTELDRSNGDMQKAGQACELHAKYAEEALQSEAIIPTRDTKSSPNVTPHTRVISVLGVDEPNESSLAASPSLGDGWMVSDFYLWLNVLSGMGKSQEWITSMAPNYLVDKYGREERVTTEEIDDGLYKPVQTKCASGFVHGDPFEDRKVVLDETLAPKLQNRVTIGPKGPELRGFFLEKLEATVAEAARCGDTVLIMIFSHGDYDAKGGFLLGIDGLTDRYDEDQLLKPNHIASVLAKYPRVKCTIYMTSCFSGHWVETTEFTGAHMKPLILAGAKKDQETFGFVWSHSQRHAGGLFSSATISELLKEPTDFPPDATMDMSREYRQVINSLVCEMHRLCLPCNIDNYHGSSPVFTDQESQERFWRRTGYRLHDYKTNYDRLKTIPASDPHPKRNRKKFDADFVDGKHEDVVAWEKRHPGILDEDYPEATGGYGSTSRGLLSVGSMKCLIIAYQSSNPGFHTQEHRALMNTIRAFFAKTLDRKGKLFLREQLILRLQANKAANQHCKLLRLYRLDSIENWALGQTAKCYDHQTFSDFAEEIARSGLYHWPRSDGKHSFYYRKPSQYLAAAMALAGYSQSEVQSAVKKLLMHRFGDTLTSQYVKTARYTRSIASIRSIVRDSWNKSRAAHQSRSNRPPLSGIAWH